MRAALRATLIIPATAWLAVACSSPTDPGPSGTTTPTPTVTPTALGTTALSSFTAEPSALDEGQTLTLRWTGTGGTVSLARKGSEPFVKGLAANGEHVLQPGLPGYPEGPGVTTYVATMGDAVIWRETSVTVRHLTPPTVALSGPDSCHPHPSTPCTVQIAASAQNHDSLSWGGCCAGSSGATGTCRVTGLATFRCTVTASGRDGSAQDAKSVQGVNDAPGLADDHPNLVYVGDTMQVGFTISDEADQLAGTETNCQGPTLVSSTAICYAATGGFEPANHRRWLGLRAQGTGDCTVEIQCTDPWGVTKHASATVTVIPKF